MIKTRHAAGLFCLLSILLWFFAIPARGQSTNATINGQITDAQGKVVPGTEVDAVNIATNVRYTSRSNNDGIYSLPLLPPGEYRLIVKREGFQEINKVGLVLHVQDTLEQNFALQLGSVSESITVSAEGNNINTTDGSVSTVIDQDFVANIPLNGRSLQSLITLAPGVQLVPGVAGGQGELSVDGQRTESNYFTVDGVSSNTGSSAAHGIEGGFAGTVPSETALGTTQSIISLDALEEFRATTSTYSAEYGRTPGGQFSFVSRSGSNEWHGSAYDYFRNNVLDAGNWFNNVLGVRQTAERQNDFGGTLGGPLRIPGLYNGKDKTFFFFSYEGLRLVVPAGASITQVPDTNPGPGVASNYTGLRENAPAVLQPFLNGYPLPNGPEVLNGSGNPTGYALFTAAYSNPSSLDAVSVRVDHNLNANMKIFGRYSGSPSWSSAPNAGQNLANVFETSINVKALTLGADNTLSPALSNQLRFNYTRNNDTYDNYMDDFGGAQPPNLAQVPGFGGAAAPGSYGFEFGLLGYGHVPLSLFVHEFDAQRQWNVTDAFSITHGSHNLKFGVDYRRLSTYDGNRRLGETVVYLSASQLLQNAPAAIAAFSDSPNPPEPVYLNFSAYAQDEWKLTQRLSFSLGLRWDVNPPPGNENGPPPYTLNQISDLSTAELAPAGTPLWKTDFHGFAPRVGLAYVLRQSASSETVIRAGFGIFYDTGNVLGSQGFLGIGFSNLVNYPGATFPLTSAQVVVPPPSTALPYDNTVYAFDPHLTLPYTMQWNFAVEQALGRSQTFTLTYLGSAGRHELFSDLLFPNAPGFSSGYGLQLTTGNASSEYDALQLQFQRKLSHGLQTLASYTWSHSIDDGTNNFFIDELLRASSDFDVRQNFELALTYDIPGGYSNPVLSGILRHWGVDTRLVARTGLPVDIQDGSTYLPNGQFIYLRPDLVPGVPVYLYGPEYPGGRILNINAFEPDPSGGQGNLPRNFARGFGLAQADLAIRRDFPINERLHLQFRTEAFNVFNRANFGNINSNLGSGPFSPATLSGFGAAQSTANVSLSGLNSLYQVGGPRSLQIMLKLLF